MLDRRPERLARAHAAALDGDAIAALSSAFALTAGSDACEAYLAALPERCRATRDDAMLSLALESLCNTVPADPDALAALIDEAVAATVPPRRPSVSIIVTCYNYAAFIVEAVRSAQSQTVAPHEIIVVDDGSTDGSAELIHSRPGITSIVKRNGGQASAFNAGFAASTGEVVIFLDADDLLLPDAVERVGRADFRGVSRLQFGLEAIDASGSSLGLYPTSDRAADGHLTGALAARGVFPFMPTSGNAFPRPVLEQLLPMPEPGWRLCADLYLVCAAALVGETASLDATLGRYRIHGRNGYFQTLGDEPYLDGARRPRQVQAWRDLSARAPALMQRRDADALRIALAGLMFADPVARRSVGPRDRIAAISTAFGAHGQSWRDRAALAAAALLPSRVPIGSATARRAHGPADPSIAAGASSWPRLPLGTTLDLGEPRLAAALGGLGFVARGRGLRLDADAGCVAFRLPEWKTNWRLEIEFAVAGDDPVRDLVVTLNGRRIDRLEPLGNGEFTLNLPHELLTRWHRPGPGALAALLRFEVPPEECGRLTLSTLRVVSLPLALAPAPLMTSGTVWQAANGRDRLAASPLRNGWNWPAGGQSTLTDQTGTLALSVPANRDHALTVRLAAPSGPAPSALLLARVNGASVDLHDAPSHDAFAIVLPTALRGTDGRMAVELSRISEPQSGQPPLALASLRLDACSGDKGQAVLPPLVRADAAAFVDRHAAGLVADGPSARLVAENIRLTLPLSPGSGRSWLSLHIASATVPVAARLGVGGTFNTVLLGRDNLVRLPLAGETGDTVTLEAHFDGIRDGVSIRSVQISPAGAALPSPEPVARFDARGLHALALDRTALFQPLDDALWLAAPRAEFALPPLPVDAVALRLTVLTTGAGNQRLTARLGASFATTTVAGLSVLELAVPAGHATVLEIESDVLVSAELVGASAPAMLGGAVCGMEVVTVATPRTRGGKTPGRRRAAA